MSDKTVRTINPLSEEVIATYPLMSDEEAAATVKASHEAFLEWRLRSLDDRAEVMGAIGQALRASKEEFAQLMTREVGKLISDSRSEVDLVAAICDYTAEHGPKVLADEERSAEGATAYVVHAPIGVIYGIQPWNLPAYQAVR